jgi:hypothetical protein
MNLMTKIDHPLSTPPPRRTLVLTGVALVANEPTGVRP